MASNSKSYKDVHEKPKEIRYRCWFPRIFLEPIDVLIREIVHGFGLAGAWRLHLLLGMDSSGSTRVDDLEYRNLHWLGCNRPQCLQSAALVDGLVLSEATT